ncbi:hypothetical protein [Nocardia carnea]|uniref:hypothetical protein n=1 Tax=Nocardia carnea TaxID=37328 RepID=UPI00245590D3|nr:hypothetical protein [Nocardia carnea]
MQKFLERAGLKQLSAEPWPKDAPELKAVDAVVVELFPDIETAMSPENADITDDFICFSALTPSSLRGTAVRRGLVRSRVLVLRRRQSGSGVR